MYHRELDHMSEQYVNRSQRQLPSQLFNHLNSILPLDCTDDCFNMPSPAVPPLRILKATQRISTYRRAGAMLSQGNRLTSDDPFQADEFEFEKAATNAIISESYQ